MLQVYKFQKSLKKPVKIIFFLKNILQIAFNFIKLFLFFGFIQQEQSYPISSEQT